MVRPKLFVTREIPEAGLSMVRRFYDVDVLLRKAESEGGQHPSDARQR